VSYWLALKGYASLEGLFIADKLQVLFSPDVNTIEAFYFTYPVLTQLINIPLALVDPIYAPIFTASLLTGVFAGFVVVHLFGLQYRLLSCLVSAYFLCSPVMVFLAASGTSTYLYLILYFFFFYFIFKYTRDFTTYNFVMISLCLSAFVFLEYNFLWILVFMIPLVLFFSVFNAIGIKKSYIGIFTQITQKSSQQRKLIGRFTSTFLIIIFTPLSSFLLYLLINYWFTGRWFYFEEISVFTWNYYEFIAYQIHNSSLLEISDSRSLIHLLERSVLFAPLFLSVLLLGRRSLLFQYTMILVPFWLVFYKSFEGSHFFNLQVFTIIVAAGIAGGIHLIHTRLGKIYLANRGMPVYVIVFTILTLVGEVYYFNITMDASEAGMNSLVMENRQDPTLESFRDMAGYINTELDKDATILTDNSIFYPTMALTRDRVTYIDQFTDTYYTALQVPALYAQYGLISNMESYSYDKDKLRSLLVSKSVALVPIHATENFTLYRIN